MVVADFIYYWTHRASHRIRLLWAYHSVHHSSKEYNLSTAVRLPWFGIIGDVMFYVPAVLLGFDPVLLAIGKAFVLLYQYWIHTESIGKLGWFDRVLNSPSNHRVHHGSNPIYLDRNHAGVLMIWDRMFGTYQEELAAEPVVYGLTKPLNSYNPLVINVHEPLALLRDVRRAGSFGNALKVLFKGPEWAPGKDAFPPLKTARAS
jgi:sterol desaturase/sphingolipid hydroxylase (fatty acid hydroxylase superfamily)